MLRQHLLTIFSAISVATSFVLSASGAMAEVVRQDNGQLSSELKVPVYQWQDLDKKPQGIVIAIHGLSLHGNIFDVCARHLAKDRMLVVAPDLRGYGRWYERDRSTNVTYDDSEKDLAKLATQLKRRYRGIPLFVAGESLGGAMAIRLAAKHPELVDGLILSAPAIKRHHRLHWRSLADAIASLGNKRHHIDVTQYIKSDYSEDPLITNEQLSDPLVRKNLSLGDLLATRRIVDSSANCLSQIPDSMPILVMQGNKDRMVKADGVRVLQKEVKAENLSITWFPERGHILLETAHIQPDTLRTLSTWIDSHRVKPAKPVRVSDEAEKLSLLP